MCLFVCQSCLFVCQSCLFVCQSCQSALPLQCLTSASSVITLQRLGPLLWLTTHWGAKEKFLLQPAAQNPALSVSISLCLYTVNLSVCLSVMSRRSRRLADTVGSNCEPAAAALGSFSCSKPGLPGRDCYGRDGPLATTGQPGLLRLLLLQLIRPHSPALTSTAQQVTPHLMPELAPPPPFSASIFIQLWRACTCKMCHCTTTFSIKVMGGHLEKKGQNYCSQAR